MVSLWNKLTGKQSAPPTVDPVVREIGGGAARVTVFTHRLPCTPPRDCWTYVTQGLASVGQRELVLTLCREPGEAAGVFPEEPFLLFETLLHFAQDGKTVDNGGFTQFGARRFYDRHILYMFAWPLEGVPIEAGMLTMMLLTDDEIEAVKMYGSLRVAARFGFRAQYYPYPTWNDRRSSGHGMFALELSAPSTLLSKMPAYRPGDLLVNQMGSKIVVSAKIGSGDRISKVLQGAFPDSPVALLTDLNPLSDGCLVWQPGQRPLRHHPAKQRRQVPRRLFHRFHPKPSDGRSAPV